ncbi:signal recognition particle-docking protein FtsY, partial [archaeon]|nr:signal recognition particle-docking protein FtsY [archaeon]
DMSEVLIDKPLKGKLKDIVQQTLKESLDEILDTEPFDVIDMIKQAEKPFVILFVGVNGAGKTTTIAKLVKYLQKENLSSVLVAADTFRSAAIEQLEHHAKALNVAVVKQSYGADPAAVAYDGVAHAKAKGLDVVLIDTAGRQQSNTNLMQELKKVAKVANPNLTLFIAESIAGSDVVTQVTQFNDVAKVDGVILSKSDVDEKGGAAISVSYVSKKPVLYLGVGQGYDDLTVFKKEEIIEQLGL